MESSPFLTKYLHDAMQAPALFPELSLTPKGVILKGVFVSRPTGSETIKMRSEKILSGSPKVLISSKVQTPGMRAPRKF